MRFTLGITTLLLAYGSAFGCTCLDPAPIDTAFIASHVVFKGKVTKVSEEFIYLMNGQEAVVYTFEVIDAMRGIRTGMSKLTMYSYTECCTCERDYQVGVEYIVFAHYDKNDLLRSSMCSQTREASRFNKDDLEKLQAIRVRYNEEFSMLYKGWAESEANRKQIEYEERERRAVQKAFKSERSKANLYFYLFLISGLWSIICTGWLVLQVRKSS